MTDKTPIDQSPEGLDRRTMLKRGAIVGGALVWTTPIVQSIAAPAFAATSPVVQGCVGQKKVAVKFDGGADGLNVNQCLPTGASEKTPEGFLFSPAIRNNDPVTGLDTLTFTLGVGDTFLSICAIGGNGILALTLVSSTKNPDGTTTFVFKSNVANPDISNFSVFFGDCP